MALDLFGFSELPTQPEGENWAYKCPQCRKHPNGGGSQPIRDESGKRTGVKCYNACCRFEYARWFTAEQIARYAVCDANGRAIVAKQNARKNV